MLQGLRLEKDDPVEKKKKSLLSLQPKTFLKEDTTQDLLCGLKIYFMQRYYADLVYKRDTQQFCFITAQANFLNLNQELQILASDVAKLQLPASLSIHHLNVSSHFCLN